MITNRSRKILSVLLPFILLASTSIVFSLSSIMYGKYSGYLMSFIFYWFFWCLFIPSLFSGKKISSLLKDKKPLFRKRNSVIILLLLSTVVGPIFIYFVPNFYKTPLLVVLMSIPLALFHGLCEELFWRGLYVFLFPDNLFFGLIFPTLTFSLWHIAPQIVIPAESGVIVFVLLTLPYGFTYGLAAYVTKSAKWSAIFHGISGIFAFSGYLASSMYALLFSG